MDLGHGVNFLYLVECVTLCKCLWVLNIVKLRPSLVNFATFQSTNLGNVMRFGKNVKRKYTNPYVIIYK